jgi:tetratricopeptide (TPR) repeat protein
MSGEADRAIGDFDQAIKLEPDHVGALYSRGLTYSNTGRWERASKTTIRLSSSARTT